MRGRAHRQSATTPRRRDWAERAAAVQSLLVLHDVASRPPLRALVAVAEAIARRGRDITPRYADLWRVVAASGASFEGAVTESIATSENLFGAVVTAGTPMDASLVAAVHHDLVAITDLAAMSTHLPRAVREATGVRVPALPNGPPSATRGISWDALSGANAVSALASHYARHGAGHFARARAFVWTGVSGSDPTDAFEPVPSPDDVHASDLVGSTDARALLRRNTANLLRGAPANNVLLYGDRGTGKSSSVKSLLNEPDREAWGDTVDTTFNDSIPWHLLRIVEVPKGRLADFPAIAAALRGRPERFVVFVDDLSFEDGETQYKDLKALLEGGVAARPANVVVYATSNRRHLIREQFSDRPDPLNTDVHGQDTIQEKLSFADRFGLTLTFTTPSQDEYVAIAAHLAQRRGLNIAPADLRRRAITWAAWHNGRSGRTARQFIDDLTAELG